MIVILGSVMVQDGRMDEALTISSNTCAAPVQSRAAFPMRCMWTVKAPIGWFLWKSGPMTRRFRRTSWFPIHDNLWLPCHSVLRSRQTWLCTGRKASATLLRLPMPVYAV